MVFAAGTSQVLAQGIALVATIPTVIVGALQHRRQGTLAPRDGLAVGVVGMATAIPGAFLAFALPVGLLRVLFGRFMMSASAGCFRRAAAVARGPRADRVTLLQPSGYSCLSTDGQQGGS